MRKLTMFAACAALAVGVSSTAMAGDLDGEKLYTEKMCVTCHGAGGKAPIAPAYPALAGEKAVQKTADDIVKQATAIRDGERTGGLTVAMKGMVGAVTDEEFKAIAEWLVSQ